MSKKRIVFVDDEPNVLEGLRRMLRKQRHEWDMEFVASGDEALAKMAESPFDVVVTDMEMPSMDGAEFLEQVLERHPDVARIVLSGHADDASTIRALRVAHQYLSKPTDAETLKAAVARACPMEQIVRNERIRASVATCNKLPSMPTLCAEVARLVESDTSDAKSVARVISRDMGMSAKLLQLVNSSFFGIARRVSTTEQAVALLGLIRIKALTLSERIFKEFTPPRRIGNFSMTQLWQHSLSVAEVAGLISKEEKQDGDRPDQAFTAGLLHDIGMLLLACQHSDEFERVLQTVRAERRPICEVEMELFNVTHAEIGAYLLGLWGLPKRLVEAVALHHNPGEIDYDGLCALTAVHVADAFVSEMEQPETDRAASLFGPTLDLTYLERIGMESRLQRWQEIATLTCGKTVEARK